MAFHLAQFHCFYLFVLRLVYHYSQGLEVIESPKSTRFMVICTCNTTVLHVDTCLKHYLTIYDYNFKHLLINTVLMVSFSSLSGYIFCIIVAVCDPLVCNVDTIFYLH